MVHCWFGYCCFILCLCVVRCHYNDHLLMVYWFRYQNIEITQKGLLLSLLETFFSGMTRIHFFRLEKTFSPVSLSSAEYIHSWELDIQSTEFECAKVKIFLSWISSFSIRETRTREREEKRQKSQRRDEREKLLWMEIKMIRKIRVKKPKCEKFV